MTSKAPSGMTVLEFCDTGQSCMSPGTITETSGLAKSIPHGSVPTVGVFKGQRDEFAGHHEHENHPEARGQQKPLVVHVVKRQPFSDSSCKGRCGTWGVGVFHAFTAWETCRPRQSQVTQVTLCMQPVPFQGGSYVTLSTAAAHTSGPVSFLESPSRASEVWGPRPCSTSFV